MITFDYNYKNIITLNTPQYIFREQIRIERLNQPRNLSAIAQLGSSSYGIHLVTCFYLDAFYFGLFGE